MTDRTARLLRTTALCAMGALGAVSVAASPVRAADTANAGPPIVLRTQGSFMVGGTVVTNPGTFDPIALAPDGQTIHGDHAYVQYQVPKNARQFPIVMWHGGGQFSKTWESTPDGRDGFQNILLRNHYTTYILDQPHRGNAGRATTNGTIAAVPGPGPTGEQGIFIRFRLGIWPDYFPGVQFSQTPKALDQWWRQQTPDTAPDTDDIETDPIAKMFNQIGPAVLLTHSAGGLYGWETAAKSDNVKGIYAYEPVSVVFPEKLLPPPVDAGPLGPVVGVPVPMRDFMKLTKIPIQLIWGDNFPVAGEPASPYPDIEIWQGRIIMAQRFVDLINSFGGHATLTHLPDIGIRGNTHFAMSDKNNVKIAGLLFNWLKENKFDRH